MFLERQPKRLCASPLPTRYGARKCYLDTIPDEILRIVLRYLSRRPQHYNWHAYVSPLLVYTALNAGGALARTALLEFQSVGGKDGIAHDPTLDASILRSLVYRLPLRRLILKFDGNQALPDLLRGCGAELRELALNAGSTAITKTDILAICTHCTKLASIAIHGIYLKSPLAPIWRSLGSTLTRVHIGDYYSNFVYGIEGNLSVADLVRHCVNLRHLDMLTLNPMTEDVLVALGSRIRVLRIKNEIDVHIDVWHEVLRACTNLEAVELSLPISEEVTDVLSLMRTKLVALTLRHPDSNDDLLPTEDRFFSVLSACSVLKEVKFDVVNMVPEAILRELFASLKAVTKLTCIMTWEDVNPVKDVIDVIGRSLTNLESLTICTLSLKGEDVDALLGLPRLKFVTMRFPFYVEWPSKSAVECAVGVMKKLKRCAQLMQLDIGGLNLTYRPLHITEAAAMYGRKDFDMFIDGRQYRTW